ncbi:hypothetical protein RB195_004261 [Necator americanus]|uniref:Uncharacterized protein n=1 Tax=Necator americanus TaxID=51031 RepID=A0ABR1BKN4_NECAM
MGKYFPVVEIFLRISWVVEGTPMTYVLTSSDHLDTGDTTSKRSTTLSSFSWISFPELLDETFANPGFKTFAQLITSAKTLFSSPREAKAKRWTANTNRSRRSSAVIGSTAVRYWSLNHRIVQTLPYPTLARLCTLSATLVDRAMGWSLFLRPQPPHTLSPPHRLHSPHIDRAPSASRTLSHEPSDRQPI